jgi:hypothetical protein
MQRPNMKAIDCEQKMQLNVRVSDRIKIQTFCIIISLSGKATSDNARIATVLTLKYRNKTASSMSCNGQEFPQYQHNICLSLSRPIFEG